jgi:putative ABC transport system substrate-binding protein
MERRTFMAVISGGMVAAPFAAVTAQPREEGHRVGYLNPGSASDPLRQRRLDAFRQGLRELGYVEGQNIAIESRWAEGQYDRYPALAANLVRLKVDVIVAQSGQATQAAQQATRTIPIVMALVIDPVGIGLVPSLARPGGNVTGTSFMAPDLVGKQLEFLGTLAGGLLAAPLVAAAQPPRMAGVSCVRSLP